jgi:hypothetical protein
MDLENQFEKKREKNFIFPLPNSPSACWPGQPAGPRALFLSPPSSLLAGPAQSVKGNRCRASFPLSAADSPGPLVGTLLQPPFALSVEATTTVHRPAPTFSASWERLPAPWVLQKGSATHLLLSLLQFPLALTRLSTRRTAAATHRRSRPPRCVGHRSQAASTLFFFSVSFTSLSSVSPCLYLLEWWSLGLSP